MAAWMASPIVFLCFSLSLWDTQPFACFVFSTLVSSFHCYFTPVLILPLSCTFHLFLSLSLSTFIYFALCLFLSVSPQTCLSAVCEHQTHRCLCVEEKEALKTKKSNCLLASNSPRHPLQPDCLYPHPGGRRGKEGGGGCRGEAL